MKTKKGKSKGPELFDEFYHNVYGERWPVLKEALLAPVSHIAWPSASLREKKNFTPDIHIPWASWDKLDEGECYYLDYASLFAPWSLAVQKGESVLDMCSAPGGKSLFLAMALEGSGELLCHDRSAPRLQRLKRVHEKFLPAAYRVNIQAELRDGKTWPLTQKERFDKILLDAPCSSERHLLHHPDLLQDWKATRSKRLSKEQGTLLCSAFEALKIGGRLTYSTCSISPLENEELMVWFSKKREGRFRFVQVEFPLGEQRSHGHLFLPDQGGHGPLYLCVLEKLS